MMNEALEHFERRVSRQSLRPVPGEWRAEILAAAKSASCPAPRASCLEIFRQQLGALLWPHPRAWAGLAAIWIFIFAVNFSMRDSSPTMTAKSAPPSPEVMVELRKQQKLLAELIGPREEREADRSKTYVPRSRTQRGEILVA